MLQIQVLYSQKVVQSPLSGLLKLPTSGPVELFIGQAYHSFANQAYQVFPPVERNALHILLH